ncbi:MAG TPA: 50S ribosomal protein L29 [Candidatus Moranbacteria bacterium]|nr:50S ribosomal protein L29 [Candidatus Moranbacteria bacterium]
MKVKEIREKNINELVRDLKEKRSIAQTLMFDVAVKQAKNHREFRNAKKDIARILTIIKEKSE